MSAPDLLRADLALVQRGLARSRGAAAELIRGRAVTCAGTLILKSSTLVGCAEELVVQASGQHFVGRGAHKLDDFLQHTAQQGRAISIADRRCLDVGASTGGFTQVLLERGAKRVVALDVGRNQLATPLRQDPRVLELSGTSVRELPLSTIGEPADVLVADLSFISLTLVMADFTRLVAPGADLILLIKPQFEVGRRHLGAGGIVRSALARSRAIVRVGQAALAQGWRLNTVHASSWPGGGAAAGSRDVGAHARGNIEYFLWATQPGEGPAEQPVESWSESDLVSAAAMLGAVSSRELAT